ncbi:MAG: hypothetical protein Q8S03_04905 [Brevundimonas sp.]|uniref:hypothetical protein n=1 Tax=Brevundimonas sp. TaxID=1871086 RepID=UPI00273378F9|nr:hypothetical protein [Brevundimonas sp.]MDP3404009.1 hypothetical protein [Brevundimonas sp.]
MAKRKQPVGDQEDSDRWLEQLPVTPLDLSTQGAARHDWLDLEDLGLSRLPVADLARDGWVPLDEVLVSLGTKVKYVKLLDCVSGGDIEDDTLRLARITLVDPNGERTSFSRLYGRTPAKAVAEDFADFGAVLRASLEEADLSALATRLMDELAQVQRMTETLSEPKKLTSASGRKAFWSYVNVQQDLNNLEERLSEPASGDMYGELLRRAINDAYQIGRWAREMELEPLQALVNVGRLGRKADASHHGKKGAEAKAEAANKRWRLAGYRVWLGLDPAWKKGRTHEDIAAKVLAVLDENGVTDTPGVETARKVVGKWEGGMRPAGV